MTQPEPPTDDSLEGLMLIGESILPHIEWAEGQKKSLEARGWTAASAEVIAREMLVGMIRKLFA